MCSPCEASTTGGPMELDRDVSEFIGCCVAREVRFEALSGGTVGES